MYSKFVESAIGQINPNAPLNSIGKTCKRIFMKESDLPSPIQSTTFEDTCDNLQKEIRETLQHG